MKKGVVLFAFNNNTIDRNTDYKPCDTCNMPKLEWEIIDGKFIKK